MYKFINNNKNGFTLIELMFVIAIIGVLGAIVFPSFQKLVTASKRADGISSIEKIHLLQEKFLNNNGYASHDLASLGVVSTISDGGHYDLATGRIGDPGGAAVEGYSITATPKFIDAECGYLKFEMNKFNIIYASETGNDKLCWKQ